MCNYLPIHRKNTFTRELQDLLVFDDDTTAVDNEQQQQDSVTELTIPLPNMQLAEQDLPAFADEPGG